MKIHEIVALCNQYGENTTLAEIRQSIQGKKKYLCPKCKGTDSITIEYNGYPSGLLIVVGCMNLLIEMQNAIYAKVKDIQVN